MPLTFSHPAAVLPLLKLCPKRFHAGALILGSMLPDLGYFLFLFPEASFAHSLPGSLALDVPLGLVLWLLWRSVTGPHGPLDRKQISRVAISLWIGALSHILWDGFTHQRGVFGSIPWLNQPYFDFLGQRWPLYKLLQHLSSVFGLAAISIYLARRRETIGWRWLDTWKLPLALAAPLSALFAASMVRSFDRLEPALYHFILYGTDALIASTLCWRSLLSRRRLAKVD